MTHFINDPQIKKLSKYQFNFFSDRQSLFRRSPSFRARAISQWHEFRQSDRAQLPEHTLMERDRVTNIALALRTHIGLMRLTQLATTPHESQRPLPNTNTKRPSMESIIMVLMTIILFEDRINVLRAFKGWLISLNFKI